MQARSIYTIFGRIIFFGGVIFFGRAIFFGRVIFFGGDMFFGETLFPGGFMFFGGVIFFRRSNDGGGSGKILIYREKSSFFKSIIYYAMKLKIRFLLKC